MNRQIALIQTVLLLSAGANLSAAEYLEVVSRAVSNYNFVDDVSQDGRVVIGRGDDPSWGNGQDNFAWRWTREEGRTRLTTDASLNLEQISADGTTIVGGYGGGVFRWTEDAGVSKITNHGLAGDVSGDGSVVVGVTTDGDRWQAFRWTEAEGLAAFDALPNQIPTVANGVSNDGAVIAGWSEPDNVLIEMEAYLWTETDGIRVIESFRRTTRPHELSGDGETLVGAGWDLSRSEDAEAFRWTQEEGMVGLGHLPGLRQTSEARATTFDGTVVIGSSGMFEADDRAGTLKGFVWDARSGMRDLEHVLRTEHGVTDLPRNSLEWPRGISDDQMTLVGWTRNYTQAGGITGWVVDLDKPLVSPLGDLNDDHYRDVADIDLLSQAIRDSIAKDRFDLNSDGVVDEADHAEWIHELKGTYFGDSNLDGEFNSSDLVAVFEAGQYGDDIEGNSTWSTGDWNGDAEFTDDDIVAAFTDGGYNQGPRAAVAAVPEPPSVWLLQLGALLTIHGRRNR